MSAIRFAGSIYPILDTVTLKKRNIEPGEAVRLWLHSGLGFYQIRAHDLNETEYTELAARLKKKYPQMLIMANDYIRAAADHPDLFAGVHAGQEDLRKAGEEGVRMLKRITREGRAAGISTHNAEELKTALQYHSEFEWSYIALGPLFQTSSKENTGPVITEEVLRQYSENWKKAKSENPNGIFPELVLIGGISSTGLRRKSAELRKAFPEENPGIALISAALDRSELNAIRKIMSYKIT